MNNIHQWRENISRFVTDGIVATNGVFDMLHVGHVRMLKIAQSYGRILVVGINSDASVKQLKGNDRPIFGQQDRAEMLRELRCVFDVFIFEGIRATEFLEAVKPNIWVKGGDYTLDTLCKEEKDVVTANGGKIIIVPTQSYWSTTRLIHQCEV